MPNHVTIVGGVGEITERKDRDGERYRRVMQRDPYRDEDEGEAAPKSLPAA